MMIPYDERLAMKRLLVLVAVLVPLSFFVTGCGGGGSSGKGGEPAAEEKQKRFEEMQKMKGNMMKGQGGKAPVDSSK
jgi:hypothetical protein